MTGGRSHEFMESERQEFSSHLYFFLTFQLWAIYLQLQFLIYKSWREPTSLGWHLRTVIFKIDNQQDLP